ncbi:acid-sensing ion channel 4-A-like [Mytilus galloprovincialis]|uniref:acid-sensing ion channel 4-A-like n=1 Tax=Mytilus galloprovincialis TaxID=29158 RepID=UPI003F7B90F7
MEKKEDSGPSLWTNFTETTGFHGLNKMTFDKKYPGRVVRSAVWAVVWLVCATVLIYIIVTQLMNYYSYPSLSSTYLRFDQQLAFPVVTVCTKNPMDFNSVSLYFDQSFVGHSEIPVVEYTDFYFYETAYMCGCACRRFNVNGTFLTSQYGISSGLFLETTSTELQIAIHDPQEDPNMARDGRTVRNGTETFIEIHRREYKSLPSPYIAYGNQICIDDANYNFVDCKRKCYNEMLMKRCSCTMNPSPTGNETYCVKDYNANTCAAELYGAILQSSTLCVCPPECRVIKYDQVLSSVANKNDYQSHYLRIRIYLKDLSTTVTEQVPKYDGVASLLANLGGQMGLFLGASILTITELLEFIIFIVWTSIHRHAKGKNAVQNISKDI